MQRMVKESMWLCAAIIAYNVTVKDINNGNYPDTSRPYEYEQLQRFTSTCFVVSVRFW